MTRNTDGGEDPTEMVSIAVTAQDVVTALEATRRGGRRTVLRVTPPFSGRMRARIHVEGGEGIYGDVRPVHVDPERLVDASLPAYPEVDETGDELRESGSYSTAAHREHHADAVAEWRSAVPDAIVDRVELETPAGPHQVAVKVLD